VGEKLQFIIIGNSLQKIAMVVVVVQNLFAA
jgi:hypothetical protein